MERLDAAAGAEVKHRVNRLGRYECGEGERCSPHAQHVIGRQRVAERELAEVVGGNEPLHRSARVDGRIGSQVEQGAALVVEQGESAGARRAQGGHREREQLIGHQFVEHEESGEDARRIFRARAGGRQGAQSWQAIAAPKSCIGLVAPQLPQPVDRIPGREQVSP